MARDADVLGCGAHANPRGLTETHASYELVQIGVLKPDGLPVVASSESAGRLRNPKLPLNALIRGAAKRTDAAKRRTQA